ncbi:MULTISPECIES: EamA family transporter [unclassified Paenibacillus]|uniref:DMT family transporter n=1 Tax=unclassified Paenibacillus TaxID=185978 RepID=UPI000955A3FC|nr:MULTISPECIES: EamA family transporter [unclassified Paenibacillus]ASS65177.1 EamA family transporter [Paenibacillus sp. RUD330]SIQ45319.1 Permease of the drug/metabolite transporter (DMT) superfamily [Paenibacillus sp. RU4X]SIQ67523.1 Permease of the drug/metabolite transporter (DMT) superfamily [Paenibacillus sp. RU4T]
MVAFNYLLMCAIFGTTFLVIKIGVAAGLPPFLSAGIRFAAAGLLLYGWMLARRKVQFSMLFRKEFAFIGAGSTFATFAGLYWAEQHIDSGMAAILSATGPMVILLMQSVALRQRAGFLERAGCGIGLLGVVTLMLPELHAQANVIWLVSCLLVLLGELGYAAGSLLTRRTLHRSPDLPPVALNAAQMIYGGIGLLILSAFAERPSAQPIDFLPAAGSLIYLTVVGSMLGHSLYAWLIKATNAFFPSTWLYISPVIALGLGALLQDERLSLLSLGGSLLVLAGIVIPRLPELKEYASSRRSRAVEAAGSSIRASESESV